jgi:hypothetical protein
MRDDRLIEKRKGCPEASFCDLALRSFTLSSVLVTAANGTTGLLPGTGITVGTLH